MAAYATAEDFEAYVEGWTTDDEDALDRLLERASDDVDQLLGGYPLIPFGDWAGRKLDPDTLTYQEGRALVRATCAQAEYRNEMGEPFFVRPQYDTTSGPEFSTTGKLPNIGPKARRELAGTGLVRNVEHSDPGPIWPPWADFTYNLDPD